MDKLSLSDQEKFLNSIMKISGNIRYVMIYDLKGNIIHKRKLDGITDLLTEEENKTALKHTIESWNFRNSVSEKIGNANYTLQVYDNLLRVIFPFGEKMLLIVTLDNIDEPKYIIERIRTILSGDSSNLKLYEKRNSTAQNDLINALKKSFDYWSKVDENSPINCFPVWKKILKDNSEILKNQTIMMHNSKQDAEILMEQFLESWAHAIRESNFKAAKASMQKWKDIWEDITEENLKIYAKVLKTLERSWENTQNKNIE